MLSEGSCVALICVFGSFAIIFFLAFFILRISGFDLNNELMEGKGYDLFPSNENQQKLMDQEGNSDGHEEEMQTYLINSFVKIHEQIAGFLYQIFKKQSVLILVTTIFFGIFVLLALDEFIGSWYATMAFLFGVSFCAIFTYFLNRISSVTISKMLLSATDNPKSSLSLGFYAGFGIMMLFFGVTIIFLLILMAIYRKIYLNDNPNLKDYGKVFVLLYGGYTLGYSFAALFYRGSSSIFQSGINSGAEILSKSDDGIEAEDQRNPASLANRVADLVGLFSASFLDITACFLLATLTSIVLVCESKELIEQKSAFYFSFLLIVFNIIVSSISSLIGVYFTVFEVTEGPFYHTKVTRLQTFLTAFFNIFVISFLPYGCFPHDFSVLTTEFDTTKEPLLNIRKNSISRGWVVFCLLTGFFLEKLLVATFEYFSSHFYSPVNSIIRATEHGPCLNLISANVLSFLIYPFTILFISLAIFLSYGILGFQGLGFATLGIISNLIPSVCIFAVGSLSANVYKLANLVSTSQKTNERVFNMSWSTRNYCSHLYALLYAVTVIGGLAAIGAMVGFLNDAKLMELKSLQFYGLMMGFAFAYLLNGIIVSAVQYITQETIHMSKNQISRIVGIRENNVVPDYEQIFLESSWRSVVLMIFPFLLDVFIMYLTGMLWGAEFLIAFLLGFLLSSSFIVFQAFVSGNALLNSKILIDNTYKVQREGVIFASASIGEIYSLSFKDSSTLLIIFMVFNVSFSMLGGRYFDTSGYISQSLGLK